MPYPGRCPHIHYMVKMKGHDKFVTQCYIDGHPGNATDGVLKRMTDPKQKQALMVQFPPLKGSKAGELTAKFDIVLGFTPEA